MWGLGLGSIMLLAVSVSLSCCDISSAPSGVAGKEVSSDIITATNSSVRNNDDKI